MFFQNLYVGALILNITVLGDRAFKEVLKVFEGIGQGPNPIGLMSLQEVEEIPGCTFREEAM